MEASVDGPFEGYAGKMGWIQVRYWDAERAEATVIVDVAPQLRVSGVPYIAFGVRPTTFDAPATTDPNVTWRAVTFLTYGPNAHVTRAVKRAAGFRWGYDVRDGVCQPGPSRSPAATTGTTLATSCARVIPSGRS